MNDDSIVISNLFKIVNSFKSVMTAGTLLAFGVNISYRGVNKDASTSVGLDLGATLDSVSFNLSSTRGADEVIEKYSLSRM